MLPKPLPLRLAIPTQVAGDLLRLSSKCKMVAEFGWGKPLIVRSLYLDEMALVAPSPTMRVSMLLKMPGPSQEVGTYNIRFEVSNPSQHLRFNKVRLSDSRVHLIHVFLAAVYPHDNTWSIFAMKDITMEFVHVMTGPACGFC